MKAIYTYILLCTLLLCSCSDQKDKVPTAEHHEEHAEGIVELTNEQFKAVGIELGLIEQKNLHSVVKASGYLEVPPQNKANVSTVIGAVVKQILVVEGTSVKQGQPLAKLEHPDFIKLQEEYVTAKNNFVYVEQEYRRQKELNEKQAGTGKIFQKAESDYSILKARISSLEHQLRLLSVNVSDLENGTIVSAMTLTSPINGYVGHINASIGAYAEPNKTLFEISDNSTIHVDLLVYEKDLFKVKTGQKVSFVLANKHEHESEAIEGVIFGINKSFESDTKALMIHAAIKDKHTDLIPGMYVNALIDVGEQTVPTIPADALVKSGGKEWIFVLVEAKNEKEHVHADVVTKDQNAETEHKHTDEKHHQENSYTFKMHEVITGVSELGYTEITFVEEIPPDAKVVVKNPFFILSKAKE
ncbi:MAG TPA: efflux RND transporter periplasmic adaptor subunit, partial [Candidatus Kapabacteria bacterium]|nr:efflux RND transporter periplasmic adaptor subunit [Candidatus Kapabacteria bacterium]